MKEILLMLLVLPFATSQSENSDGSLVWNLGSNNANNANSANNVEEEPTTAAPTVVNVPDVQYAEKPPLDYATALAMSMLFYEAQRSGPLPEDQRVKWRGDSALNDGEDVGLDLTGGYYDGASYVKYGYSMAYATTVLSWGVIRYRRTYEILNQLDNVLATIRWATDYFIKCHTGDYEYYGQVSDKSADSQFWGRPEDMNYKRVSYKITRDKPGSDLAGETAAALTAASIVFEPTDPTYSDTLLTHAQQLHEFATRYRGLYSRSIPMAAQAYGSSEFRDELAWSAAWLYKRTGDMMYLRDAEQMYKRAKLGTLATEFSWSNKQAGVQILLAELTKKKTYKNSAQWFCEHSQKGRNQKFRTQSKYTPKGLLFLNQWGPLRYAANSAFICLMAADLNLNNSINRPFAASQINYMLGAQGQSFLVGFGKNFPRHPYHKSSYCPDPPAICPRFDNDIPNEHILYGALIGGPSDNDQFRDQRSNEKQNSVTMDFNAGFQSALAGLLDLYIFGPNHRPHIDQPGVITVDEPTLPPPTERTIPTVEKGVKYGDILNKSLLFYEAQRSGTLSLRNRVEWRATSGLEDGLEIERDLTGGYYDGASYVKYSFPMFYSMTMLSWSLIEYEDAYRRSGQYFNAVNALRWGINYMEKCHFDRTSIVGQVGDPAIESRYWDIPERMNFSRPVYVITPENPGTEISAEMAASFAAASIVLRKTDALSADRLYNRSRFIFQRIATSNTASYTDFITSAATEYPSSGYTDELAWAAAWLDQNKRHQVLFNEAMRYYSSETPKDFSYDNKTAGVQLLMAMRSLDFTHISTFCNWLVDSAPRTPNGMIYLSDKYSAQHAANAAFILLLTYEKNRNHYNAKKWRDTGVMQVQLLLGYYGQSYVVGHGIKPPQQPYHRASSCPGFDQPCGFKYKSLDAANPRELIGALVGGPSIFDDFADKRENIDQSAVSLAGNAGLQASVAALLHLEITNQLGNTASTSVFRSDGIMTSMLFSVLLTQLTVTWISRR